MANPRTIAKIAARIKERVAHAVEFELNDPRSTFITVTRTEVSPDLAVAKVYYSVLGTEGDRSKAEHMLESATGFIQRQVARVLRTRRVPRLRWIYDESIEYAANMDRVIREAIARDRAIHPGAHAEIDTSAEDPDGERAVAREYEEFLSAQEEEEGPQPGTPPSA